VRRRVHGSHLGLEGVEIDPPSTEPRPEDRHVLGDPPRVHRVGIFGQLDEVGQLADLERGATCVTADSSKAQPSSLRSAVRPYDAPTGSTGGRSSQPSIAMVAELK
jgi:hypothetical protein